MTSTPLVSRIQILKNIKLLALLYLVCNDASAQNIEFRSNLPYSNSVADVWGWSDNGREYAIIGHLTGFEVVEVTDPDVPVRLHEVPGPATLWRDIKTFGHYAYGVHEGVDRGVDQGLVIMDLSQLPDDLPVSFWHTDGTEDIYLSYAHNLFIDEKGIAYIVGHNMGGGVLMLDLNNDPTAPRVVGSYTSNYVHDCFVRNDTLWTAEMRRGEFAVIDIRTKSNPLTLARQQTPMSFTHNLWLSDNGRTLYTTDEQSGAPVAAYDVSDLSDIRLLDEYRSSFRVIPHNVHTRNEFVVISYYADGVIILDGSFPDELVEIASFDTAPDFSGDVFRGAWGVYPYLPSGNLLVSDMDRGLFVLTPNYVRAAHIRGKVLIKDAGSPIVGAFVSITSESGSSSQVTDLNGNFSAGFSSGGTFQLTLEKQGYEDVVMELELDDGELEVLTLEMVPKYYLPGDTVQLEVQAGLSVSFCDPFTNAISADRAFSSNGNYESAWGSWSPHPDLCMVYHANGESVDRQDSLCWVVENSSSEEYHATWIIVSISSIPTAAHTTKYDTSPIKILGNPVSDHIRLSLDLSSSRSYSFRIMDTQGGTVARGEAIADGVSLLVPANGLRQGLYLLALRSRDGVHHAIKFIR